MMDASLEDVCQACIRCPSEYASFEHMLDDVANGLSDPVCRALYDRHYVDYFTEGRCVDEVVNHLVTFMVLL